MSIHWLKAAWGQLAIVILSTKLKNIIEIIFWDWQTLHFWSDIAMARQCDHIEENILAKLQVDEQCIECDMYRILALGFSIWHRNVILLWRNHQCRRRKFPFARRRWRVVMSKRSATMMNKRKNSFLGDREENKGSRLLCVKKFLQFISSYFVIRPSLVRAN
jgi:hypothetical protein